MADNQELVLQMLENLQTGLNRVSEVLTGNGTVEKGVVSRLTRLEDSVSGCQQTSKTWRENFRANDANKVSIICAVISSAATILCGVLAVIKIKGP